MSGHDRKTHEKQTPGRPKCFSSPSGGRTPQGGGLGGALRLSAAVRRIGTVDQPLHGVEHVLPGAESGVEVQRIAHAAFEHRGGDGSAQLHENSVGGGQLHPRCPLARGDVREAGKTGCEVDEVGGRGGGCLSRWLIIPPHDRHTTATHSPHHRCAAAAP